MTEKLTKIPFHGDEITAIEKDGRIFVAMKPICEAMELEWRNQHELIRRDPVLNSTVIVTMTVAADGREREMLCLPLEYLNGWLFKVPASRYIGRQREVIELYQRECYQALFDYWHKGGAVNPRLDSAQADCILTTLKAVAEHLGESTRVLQSLDDRNRFLENFSPKSSPYGISKITGRARDRYVRGYFTSNKSGRLVANLGLQLELPLQLETQGS